MVVHGTRRSWGVGRRARPILGLGILPVVARLLGRSYLFRVSGHGPRVSIARVSAAVRVRVSDLDLVGDLGEYLEAVECNVRKVGRVTLDVSRPRSPSDDQALREIAIHLRAWSAMHPGAVARVVGEGETR